MLKFDRSRYEASNRCLRLRFWAYEFKNSAGTTGLQAAAQPVPLTTGIADHHGLALLFVGKSVDRAVDEALHVYHDEVSAGLQQPVGEATPQLAIVEEQLALIEAQIRGFNAVSLHPFLARFDPILVETEMEPYALGGDLALMVRCDLVARRKSDGMPFIIDFKSVANPGPWWREGFRYDTVTLSQVLPVEAHLREPVGGVVIVGLVKGARLEYPKGSGVKQQNSPLIYAWHNGDRWETTYDYTCTAPHKKGNGQLCPGNANHRLDKSYYKAKVWEKFSGGIAAWIDHLAANEPELLAQQFLELPAILRSDWEIEEWRLSATAAEARIARDAEWCNSLAGDGPSLHRALAEHFPKNTTNGGCPGCSFRQMCWGGATVEDFEPRSFNHSTEAGGPTCATASLQGNGREL